MGVSVIKQNDKTSAYVTEYIVTTKAEMDSISVKNIDPGSICVVAEDASVHILTAEKEWKEL